LRHFDRTGRDEAAGAADRAENRSCRVALERTNGARSAPRGNFAQFEAIRDRRATGFLRQISTLMQ